MLQSWERLERSYLSCSNASNCPQSECIGGNLGSIVPSSDSKKNEELKSKLERVTKEIDKVEVRSSKAIQSEEERDLDSGMAYKERGNKSTCQGNDKKPEKLPEIEREYCHTTNHRRANCYERATDIVKGKTAVEWRRNKVRFHDEPSQDAGKTMGPAGKFVAGREAEEDCALMYNPATR